MSDIDYGPLAALLGTWQGDKGVDIAPEPDGTETNPYFETITVTEAGDVTNAESQQLVCVHYRQLVTKKANGEVFHDQTGYWMWDASSGLVMHAFSIPRGVTVLAGGTYSNASDSTIFKLSASQDKADFTITESPFMRESASTRTFSQHVEVTGNKMSYAQEMLLDIYGREFLHTDKNELLRQ